MKQALLVALAVLMTAGAVGAGEADVLQVEVERTGERTYAFHVTVRHADEGWDHYADGWEILAPDGTVLGKRVLYHPHVGEQPFTRSLAGVIVPEGVTEVTVRAQDSVHGTGGKTLVVAVP